MAMAKSLALIVVVIILCSGLILIEKYRVETINNSVELTADYDLFAAEGQLDLLKKFSPQIIKSLAVEEKSLAELASEKQLHIYNSWELQGLSDWGLDISDLKFDQIYISGPSKLLDQAAERLKIANGINFVRTEKQLIIAESKRDSLTKAVSFTDEALQLIQAENLQFVPRVKSSTTPQELELILAKFPAVSTVIFRGQEVAGYPHQLAATAKKLQQAEVKLGLIESFLAQQLGADKVAEKMNYQAVRVHSIKQQELDELGVQKAVDRYYKAVQERNVRLLYLKPFTEPAKTKLFLTSLKEKLEQANYSLGTAEPFQAVKSSYLLKGIIITAVLILVTLLLKTVNLKLALITLSSGVIGLVLTYFLAGELMLLAVGLLLAVLVPSGEYLYLLSREQIEDDKRDYRLFLLLSVVSTLTGLTIAALLFDTAYLLQIKQFRGIKISFLAPLLLGVIYYYSTKLKSGFELKQFVTTVIKRPVRWQDILLVSGLLLMFSLYLGRTGNQFWWGVSKLEFFIRDYLAAVFRVRPRFKSFLIGHPLLLLGLKVKAQYQPWLLLGGLIGQINIINTLLHLHMPLEISLLRVGLGIFLGGIIYIAVITAYRGTAWLKRKVIAKIN